MSQIANRINEWINANDEIETESEKYDFLKTLYSDENIELKTEINDVVSSCRLRTLIQYALMYDLKITAQTLIDFDRNYLVRMLSNKRESRKEAFQSITSMQFTEKDKTEDSKNVSITNMRGIK